jgi:hypothetical protein
MMTMSYNGCRSMMMPLAQADTEVLLVRHHAVYLDV